jgi:hypothetical protein
MLFTINKNLLLQRFPGEELPHLPEARSLTELGL